MLFLFFIVFYYKIDYMIVLSYFFSSLYILYIMFIDYIFCVIILFKNKMELVVYGKVVLVINDYCFNLQLFFYYFLIFYSNICSLEIVLVYFLKFIVFVYLLFYFFGIIIVFYSYLDIMFDDFRCMFYLYFGIVLI